MVMQDFRNLLTAQPFEPFRLAMSSGQTVDVRHPELALVTRTKIYVNEMLPNGQIGNTANAFSLLHVTKIEFLDQEPVEAEQDEAA
jgi:hypothetical protein